MLGVRRRAGQAARGLDAVPGAAPSPLPLPPRPLPLPQGRPGRRLLSPRGAAQPLPAPAPPPHLTGTRGCSVPSGPFPEAAPAMARPSLPLLLLALGLAAAAKSPYQQVLQHSRLRGRQHG